LAYARFPSKQRRRKEDEKSKMILQNAENILPACPTRNFTIGSGLTGQVVDPCLSWVRKNTTPPLKELSL
jgi:hypothetical protein